MKFKEIVKVISIPVVFASLCCLSPLVLVMLGISTVTFGASLSTTLYEGYKWYFRIAGLVLLGISLVIYFRSKGICTLDQAKRKRNEVINTILIVLLAGIVGYIVFLYGIVEYIGILFGLW